MKPGNLVFRRLLVAGNERQVRINLMNIAKGTFIALPANGRHSKQCGLCEAYHIKLAFEYTSSWALSPGGGYSLIRAI